MFDNLPMWAKHIIAALAISYILGGAICFTIAMLR